MTREGKDDLTVIGFTFDVTPLEKVPFQNHTDEADPEYGSKTSLSNGTWEVNVKLRRLPVKEREERECFISMSVAEKAAAR
jgi:hypothetical protein